MFFSFGLSFVAEVSLQRQPGVEKFLSETVVARTAAKPARIAIVHSVIKIKLLDLFATPERKCLFSIASDAI